GRAVETVRYTLRRYEREHPERAIFGGSSEPRGAGDGELVYQLYRQGERVRELARRLGRSESAIYRMLAEVRARRVLSRRIEFVYSAEFERPDADAVILGGGGGENGIDGGAGGDADKAVPVRLQQLYRLGLLSRQRERELFRRYNYLKFKAARLQERIEPSRPRTRQLEQIERLLAEADEIKNRIIQANLRLVVSIARRHAGCAVGLNELISDGNVSLMRAVEKFDYTRGNKFSTYATLAIMKNYARTIPEENYRLGRFQTGRQEVLEVAPAAAEDAAWPDERRGLELGLQRVLSKLSARERLIVTRHYGLVEDGRRQTLEQIGKLLGLTKERVRQIEKRALARLRDLLSLPMSGGLNLSG
ncbi:MAG: sigma-70 family RNA polymerase sigma factor, partial [Phycisphaerae bacterium]